MEYQSWVDSPLEVGSGAPSEGAANSSPLEEGVCWSIIMGMLFLELWDVHTGDGMDLSWLRQIRGRWLGREGRFTW